jgi:gamma-aminobutyric acid receptor subunit beta
MKLRGGNQVAPDGIHMYPKVTAGYTAVRNGLFFTWKLFVPLGLIVMMAYTVFWLDPTLLSTQIAIATSTVFTLIAYNFALSNILPQVSYLTRADVYLLGSMLLVFSALGEAVVTGVLARNEKNLALARRIDVIARYVYPALFVGVVILAFI